MGFACIGSRFTPSTLSKSKYSYHTVESQGTAQRLLPAVSRNRRARILRIFISGYWMVITFFSVGKNSPPLPDCHVLGCLSSADWKYVPSYGELGTADSSIDLIGKRRIFDVLQVMIIAKHFIIETTETKRKSVSSQYTLSSFLG